MPSTTVVRIAVVLILATPAGFLRAATVVTEPVKKDSSITLKSKFGPRDIEVKLQDGSVFRGEIKDLESIVIKTAYGTLSVPIADMLRIDRGERMNEKDAREIADNLKDLDNDEFAKRAAAQYKLETLPAIAAETIKPRAKTATPESKNRIDGILKKLTAKWGNGQKDPDRRHRANDALRSRRRVAIRCCETENARRRTFGETGRHSGNPVVEPRRSQKHDARTQRGDGRMGSTPALTARPATNSQSRSAARSTRSTIRKSRRPARTIGGATVARFKWARWVGKLGGERRSIFGWLRKSEHD